MPIEIGKVYEIVSKTANPGENKYKIEATDWNSEILKHLQKNSNPTQNGLYGDWIITDNPPDSDVQELPTTLKERFGIVNEHNSSGGYSRKRKLKKRPTARRRGSSKRKARTTRRK
jgi:hypothetical protein